MQGIWCDLSHRNAMCGSSRHCSNWSSFLQFQFQGFRLWFWSGEAARNQLPLLSHLKLFGVFRVLCLLICDMWYCIVRTCAGNSHTQLSWSFMHSGCRRTLWASLKNYVIGKRARIEAFSASPKNQKLALICAKFNEWSLSLAEFDKGIQTDRVRPKEKR